MDFLSCSIINFLVMSAHLVWIIFGKQDSKDGPTGLTVVRIMYHLVLNEFDRWLSCVAFCPGRLLVPSLSAGV